MRGLRKMRVVGIDERRRVNERSRDRLSSRNECGK
jgi:hypothetical protein